MDRSDSFFLTHVSEPVFQDLLLGRAAQDAPSTQEFFRVFGGRERRVFLLAFRKKMGFEYTELFAISNMLEDLLPAGTKLLTVETGRDLLVLADAAAQCSAADAAQRVCQELQRFASAPVLTAESAVRTMAHLAELYDEIQLLLRFAQEEQTQPTRHHTEPASGLMSYFNLRAIGQAHSCDELLFESYLAFSEMELCGLPAAQREKFAQLVLRLFSIQPPTGVLTAERTAVLLAEKLRLSPRPRKEALREEKVLTALYRHLSDPDISLQSLAANELYMNADYLGRVFVELTGQHFSAFMERRRIDFACRLLQFRPDFPVSSLAVQVGYPSNGQYFSRVFRRLRGMTPRDYRHTLVQAKQAGLD